MLKVSKLYCKRGNQLLFGNLTFSLPSSSCLQVLGKNGAGKSSLLRMLAGFLSPFSGKVEWCQTPTIWTTSERCQTPTILTLPMSPPLYIGHQTGLKLSLTPRENLEWWAAIHQRKDFRKNFQLNNLFLQTRLLPYSDIPCDQLSLGIQKRIALLRLKIQCATLWLIDEPFTALDVFAKNWFLQSLKDHLKEDGIAVIATHSQLSQDEIDSQIINLDDINS